MNAWVPGEPGDRVPITNGRDSAAALAGFLRALHVEAPSEAPRSPFRGVPIGDRAVSFEESLADVSWRLDESAVRRLWDDAVNAPGWNGPRLWLHVDLHAANIVVANKTLAGVIDFGDHVRG